MECAVTKAKLKEALEIIRRQDASLEAGATAMAKAGKILDISADRLMNLGLAYEAVKAELEDTKKKLADAAGGADAPRAR